ncbi:MAG: hypothetical protein GW787_11350 [Betaproteobacteria bacterium]|nr:hypothetical protein [Betaproteobacteria bacterium]
MPRPYILEIALLLMDCITITPADLMEKHTTFPIKKREALDCGLLDQAIHSTGVRVHDIKMAYAHIGTYSENFLDLFSGSAALMSLRSIAS